MWLRITAIPVLKSKYHAIDMHWRMVAMLHAFFCLMVVGFEVTLTFSRPCPSGKDRKFGWQQHQSGRCNWKSICIHVGNRTPILRSIATQVCHTWSEKFCFCNRLIRTPPPPSVVWELNYVMDLRKLHIRSAVVQYAGADCSPRTAWICWGAQEGCATPYLLPSASHFSSFLLS